MARARSRAARIALRILRWTLGVVVGLVVIVVALALVLLYSRGAFAWAAGLALGAYNERIPGAIEVTIDGRLADDLRLAGLVARDRDGQTLLEVDALELRWSAWALLAGDLRVDALTIEGVRVYLTEGPGFSDLAIPGPPEPEPEPEPLGPSMPLDLTIGALHLADAAIVGEDGAARVRGLDLELRDVAWSGGEAALAVVDGRATIPELVTITALQLEARWSAPTLALVATIESDLARVWIASERFDVEALTGSLSLAVDAPRRAVIARVGEALGERLAALDGDPSLRLRARAREGAAELGLVVRAPGLAELSLAAAGPLRGPPNLTVGGHARVNAPALLGRRAAPLGVVEPVFLASSEGTSWEDLQARLLLQAPALGGLEVRARGRRDGAADEAAIEVAIAGAGVDLEAAATLDHEGLARARWRLAIPELSRTAALADRFAEVPPLAGSLRTRGSCAGEAPSCAGTLAIAGFAGAGVRVAEVTATLEGRPLKDAPTARVDLRARDLRAQGFEFADVELHAAIGPSMTEETGPLTVRVDLEAGSPGRRRADRIAIDAHARLGEPLEVEARALALRLRELDAHLERPARVRVDGRRITVDDLDLALAGGHVRAGGVVDLAGRSDLVVDVDEVRLRPLNRLISGLRAAGVVDAHARLRGPADAPTIDAQLTGDALALRGAAIGDLVVAVDLAGGQATARVDLRGPIARQVQVRASAPLRLDIAAGEVSVPGDRIEASAAIDRLDLAALRDFAPDAPALAGVVDLQASVDGLASRPRAEVDLRARDLAVGDQPVGALTVEGSWASDGDARATITAERRGATLVVEGRALPVRLDLTRGVRLHRAGDVDVLVTAEGVDLRRQLAGFVDEDERIAGAVGLRAWIHGPLRAPEVALGLAGEGLRARGLAIGDLRLQATYRDARAEVDLSLAGALARALTLHAAVPLQVRPLAGEFTWLKGQEHEVTLAVDHFDLACLGLAGVAPGLTGVVDLDARVDGDAGDPRIAVDARARRLTWREQRVGGVDLEAGYQGRRATVDVAAGLGARTTLVAHGRAPLDLDLERGAAGWIDGERGELDLAIAHLDPEALAIAGPLPSSMLLDVGVHLEASGTPRAFTSALAVAGEFGHRQVGPMPLRVDVKASEARQRLDLELGRGEGSLRAEVAAKADVLALARGRAEAGAIPIEAAIAAESVDLRAFEAALPEALFDLKGLLRADLRAHGSVGEPVVDGVLALEDGGVTILPLQQRLEGIEVELRADGRRFKLERLAAASGPGTLRGEGLLELGRAGKLLASGEVTLRHFPLVRPGLPQMQIDTRVRARARSDADETEVAIKVSDTEVAITGVNTAAPKPIPESDAVTFHDDRDRVSVAVDLAPPPAEVGADSVAVAPEPPEEEPEPRRFTLSIALTEPVEIEGPATMMRWDGKVTAITRGDDREVRGQLRAQGGHIDLLGNRFAIESGTVTLPEDEDTIDPFLNLVARAPTSAALVTATFRGRLSRPELIFSSEPPMSQSAILTLLVTGSADASQADEGKVLAKAASLLASFKNPALSQYLDRKLGIDRVGIGFGEGLNQPILTVGKRVTSDLYVETALRINAPRQQNRVEVRVEYEFVPHWTLETFFGDAAVGGLDVFWRRVFGKPQAPGRPGPAEAPRGAARAPAPTRQTQAVAPTGGAAPIEGADAADVARAAPEVDADVTEEVGASEATREAEEVDAGEATREGDR